MVSKGRTARVEYDSNGHNVQGKIIKGGDTPISHGVSATDKDSSWRSRNNNKPLTIRRTVCSN